MSDPANPIHPVLRLLVGLGVVALCLLGATPPAAEGEPRSKAGGSVPGPIYSNNPVVAVVEGHPIYLNELRNAPIHEMMVQLHRMQKIMLQEKALEYLLPEHPELAVSKPAEVTREDIVRFYRATAEVKNMGSLEQMEANIRHYLEGLSHADYLQRVDQRFQQAVEKGYIQDYFAPPQEFKLVAPVGTAMTWFQDGQDQTRRVFFLEFSDFQCPFCKRVQPTLRKLRKRYSHEVQFGYRHFPLPFHKQAARLAEAVECAREQGRFWEVQWVFYQNSDAVQDYEGMIQWAERAGVKNMERFEECVKTGKYRKRVQKDIEDGSRIGINGTPSFLIGLYDPVEKTISGEMFSGAVPEKKFIEVIEKYLAVEPKVAESPCRDC